MLGGILVNPPRSRTRRAEFKLIERLPDQLQGQFKFYRDEGPVFRPLTLVTGGDSTGAWREGVLRERVPSPGLQAYALN